MEIPLQGVKLVFVTGPSGAGRTTALRVLEDFGYEVIDNIPMSLIPKLFGTTPLERSLALGLDVRNRDFDARSMVGLVESMRASAQTPPAMLYLDSAPQELLRRFSETRRRHPLASDELPADAIGRELALLAPIRELADHLIDTTDLTPHDLKAQIAAWFGLSGAGRMAVSLQSFSYRRGLPAGVDMVFDCRFLDNPHWRAALRPLDGRDARVQDYLRSDPHFGAFFDKVSDLLHFLLPAHVKEGKAHLSVGFGCTGGQHRSVALVEVMGAALETAGWPVTKRHRELERKALVQTGPADKVTGA